MDSLDIEKLTLPGWIKKPISSDVNLVIFSPDENDADSEILIQRLVTLDSSSLVQVREMLLEKLGKEATIAPLLSHDGAILEYEAITEVVFEGDAYQSKEKVLLHQYLFKLNNMMYGCSLKTKEAKISKYRADFKMLCLKVARKK
ncbi:MULTISPECIES: hypothetical protein [unclassified Pseudoalteromonas]|uniref:hypothetical protein n=1 Tax=unclassified Pseudoalteromonas TaxID=194690 RepID=UPI0025742978|nr:hypothetical protein [Pseudoalteromonas sp. MM1]BED91127.1 hypothetical protein PspMM1_35950 [Pseudoalteromonas sp. MM1]